MKPKYGLCASRRTELTGSRAYVPAADIACAQNLALTILPSRLFSRPTRHMYRTLKAFVAYGAYAERRTWYLLPAKYR
jgi:hypothetical protein